jgi:hypothetical protein
MQISHLPGRAEEHCRLSIAMADSELSAIVSQFVTTGSDSRNVCDVVDSLYQ